MFLSAFVTQCCICWEKIKRIIIQNWCPFFFLLTPWNSSWLSFGAAPAQIITHCKSHSDYFFFPSYECMRRALQYGFAQMNESNWKGLTLSEDCKSPGQQFHKLYYEHRNACEQKWNNKIKLLIYWHFKGSRVCVHGPRTNETVTGRFMWRDSRREHGALWD